MGFEAQLLGHVVTRRPVMLKDFQLHRKLVAFGLLRTRCLPL